MQANKSVALAARKMGRWYDSYVGKYTRGRQQSKASRRLVLSGCHATRCVASRNTAVKGCLPFSQIIRMEWSLRKGKRFSEFNDLPDENCAYNLLHSIPSRIFYSILWERTWKRKAVSHGKSISRIPFRTEKEDYLWRLSTISEKTFRKIAFPFDLKPKFPDVLAKW